MMRRFVPAALVLCAVVWQAFRSHSPWLSWLVVGPVVAWGVHWFITSRKEKREGKELEDWHRRLESVVDIRDFEDDGHLHEFSRSNLQLYCHGDG